MPIFFKHCIFHLIQTLQPLIHTGKLKNIIHLDPLLVHPVVPNLPLPQALFRTRAPLIVGLTKDPARLVDVRRTRLRAMGERNEAGSYADLETVAAEVQQARRLCAQRGWPVIDVTRRSIEETAAAIFTLLQEHRKVVAQ